VHDARRWVVDACADMGRTDLAACAELGVSELVTNALLHGSPPIEVKLGGTIEHPRVEVRDASTERPVLPTPRRSMEDDDLLLTFGRGLSIVARSSEAWGAEIEEDGKTMWFTPAAQFAAGDGIEGLITGAAAAPAMTVKDSPEAHEFVIRDVPLKEYVAFQHHYRELRREVRLLALAHQTDYPLAKNLSDLFGSLEQPLSEGMGIDQVQTALADGGRVTDVHVVMLKQSARSLDRFIELLELADAFCREERLLSLARTPLQQRFQRWFLGEFVRQSKGGLPLPWSGSPRDSAHQTSVS